MDEQKLKLGKRLAGQLWYKRRKATLQGKNISPYERFGMTDEDMELITYYNIYYAKYWKDIHKKPQTYTKTIRPTTIMFQ